jgi:hypothetical protein
LREEWSNIAPAILHYFDLDSPFAKRRQGRAYCVSGTLRRNAYEDVARQLIVAKPRENARH